jgi:hypothetical protein
VMRPLRTVSSEESVLGGTARPLFLRPTGLAVGLALKEQRYDRGSWSIRPRGGRCLPFGSPAPRRLGDAPGIRQALNSGGTIPPGQTD